MAKLANSDRNGKTRETIERHNRNLKKYENEEKQIFDRFNGDIERFKTFFHAMLDEGVYLDKMRIAGLTDVVARGPVPWARGHAGRPSGTRGVHDHGHADEADGRAHEVEPVRPEVLEDHPLVASYRFGDAREGGDGVTIVELKG